MDKPNSVHSLNSNLRPPAGRRHLARLLAALVWLAAVGLGGCATYFAVSNPALEPLLPEVVDSLVPQPFAKAPDVEINAADLALLDTHLKSALEVRKRFRLFDQPPTDLPNTVVLRGTLETYRVEEVEGDGLFLRTIELKATLAAFPVLAGAGVKAGATTKTGEVEPLAQVQRRLAWQKAYPGTQGVKTLVYDLDFAVRELTEQLAEALQPTPQGIQQGGASDGPIVLEAAVDPYTGKREAVSALIRGNGLAAARRYDLAIKQWQTVLYAPHAGPPPAASDGAERRYQVSSRVLELLQRRGTARPILERLLPLTQESPMELVDFRAALRVQFGGAHEIEGTILELADTRADRMQLNLTAAHANLGAVYRLQKRYDLAAYHLARAWGLRRTKPHEVAWQSLQDARGILHSEAPSDGWLVSYLRVPPPATAPNQPGSYELQLLPPLAFALAAQDRQAGATQGSLAGNTPRKAQNDPLTDALSGTPQGGAGPNVRAAQTAQPAAGKQ